MTASLSRLKKEWAIRETAANRPDRCLWGSGATMSLSDFARGTSLCGNAGELAGRSVLLVARDQLAAALALIELDGLARRIVLCPPDVDSERAGPIIGTASVDAIVCDKGSLEIGSAGDIPRFVCSTSITRSDVAPDTQQETEWILLSSGTSSGMPKLVAHTLATLTAPIRAGSSPGADIVWGTFYDIRRYGGLQIFLRAISGQGSMVLSGSGEPVLDHLARLKSHGVTHLSGTPSHWRRVLLSGHPNLVAPRYVRLSGEIADQAILDMLKSTYPESIVAHAFASTEAGVAFEVNDGLSGFPASYVGHRDSVEVQIKDHSLRLRSDRTAIRYLGNEHGAIADEDGFVDTGDIVEFRDERYHFLGRRNGTMNIGGLKVHPEEIEAVINGHPRVAASMVRARRNPILGAVVSAEVVLKPERSDGHTEAGNIEDEILDLCRVKLPPYKVPATLRVVTALGIAEAGKMARHDA